MRFVEAGLCGGTVGDGDGDGDGDCDRIGSDGSEMTAFRVSTNAPVPSYRYLVQVPSGTSVPCHRIYGAFRTKERGASLSECVGAEWSPMTLVTPDDHSQSKALYSPQIPISEIRHLEG